jgi:hypothetical protein
VSEDVTGETEALAAEYVLGTLDFEERNGAESLRVRDPEFAAKVKIWERRLGELHLMVEPVEPDPEIWSRIAAKLPAPKPAEPVSAAPAPATAFPERERKPTSEPDGALEAARVVAPVSFAPIHRQADDSGPPEPTSDGPKSAEAKPAEAKSAEAKSAEAKSAEAKAAEAEFAQLDSTEARSAETRSAETKSAEAKSAETRSAETKSAETKSAETKSAEPDSADAKSADAHSASASSAAGTAAAGSASLETAEPKLDSHPPSSPAPETVAASEGIPASGVSFSDVALSEAEPGSRFDVSAAAASAIADALAAPGSQAAGGAVRTVANVVPAAKLRVTQRRLTFWRAAALVMALALLSAAALVALWRYLPERVPAELRPFALMRLVGIAIDTSVPQRKPAPPESRFDE